jgi:hypothetical protein
MSASGGADPAARPDGGPAVVSDPSRLETPLLQRILRVLREEYDPEFAFRWLGPLPWAPLEKPLSGCRVALVTTGSFHRKGDAPFDLESSRWGDPSYRLIPHLTPPSDLELTADYVDRKYIARDPEVALPMRALGSLADRGVIGSAAPRHASFCGGVLRPYPGLAAGAAALRSLFRDDGVDAAVILPTCSVCVQNVCVIAREMESRGLPTVVGSFLPELTRIAGAPRCLTVSFPLGAPCGNPDNRELQLGVLEDALDLLRTATAPGTMTACARGWRSEQTTG